MDVIVCAKLAPDPEDIQVNSDGSISLENAEWVIGSFDLQAIEAAVRLAEATAGKVTVLTAGPHQVNNSKLKKDLLSRGPHALVMVVDEALASADTALTAAVLAGAIRKMGGADVALFGEGSADLYFQQTGLQVGERLGWPTLNAVSRIEPQENSLLIERNLEEEIEVLQVPLPAAISVTVDITTPRLPTMMEILKAGQKPVTVWTLADLGLEGQAAAKIATLSVRAPQQVARKRILIEDAPEEAAQTLAAYLSKEGLV